MALVKHLKGASPQVLVRTLKVPILHVTLHLTIWVPELIEVIQVRVLPRHLKVVGTTHSLASWMGRC